MMVQQSGGIDVALAPIGLLIVLAIGVGLLLLLAALVKHGYGKSLAIIFGGALCLLVFVMGSMWFISYPRKARVTAINDGPSPTQVTIDDLGNPKIELEKTVSVTPSSVTIEGKKIEVDPQDEPKAKANDSKITSLDTIKEDVNTSDSKSEDSEQTLKEWTASHDTNSGNVLTAEPYLGSVVDQQGNPVNVAKIDLMNQLTEWLANEIPGLNYYSNWLDNTPNSPGLNYYSNWLDNTPNSIAMNAPAGTTQDELWQRFVADYHITKQTTSVGDTETLSILVTTSGEPMAWIRDLVKSQELQRSHNSRLRFYLLGGGGTFFGLVTLYGLLSVGSKESDPTNG